MNWQIFIGALVGLIIFMYGIENFSREVLSFAGDRFRKALRKATKNRFNGAIVGTIVTALIQSSTATTVITISLVSAGIISLTQSLGVIVGANVGTTITAQLVAFKVTAYAPIFIILGFLGSLLKPPYKYIGKGLFYFGMVFFGLGLISDAVAPLRDNPQTLEFFASLSNPYIALLAGIGFTAAVQSSSISTGLVVILAGNGLLGLEQGVPILLGTNIGTTVSAMLASSRLSLHAKRAAVAHSIFNIAGVLLILPFIKPFIALIESLGGSNAQQLANAHTIFNVAAALLFLSLIKPLNKLVLRAVKGEEKEILIGTKYLKHELPKTNKSSLRTIERELTYLFETVFDSYESSIGMVSGKIKFSNGTIEKYETLADLLDEKIEAALLDLSQRSLGENEAKKVVLLVRISNLAEQLADRAKYLAKLPSSSRIASPSMSMEALDGVEKIYSRMTDSFKALENDFPNRIESYAKLSKQLSSVKPMIAKGYNKHIARLKKRQAYGGSVFVESSSILEDSASRLKEILKLCQQYARLSKKVSKK